MGSVGALGIGLSVVFSVFLVLLLAELYYLVFWKRKSLLSSSRVNSVAPERSRDLSGDLVPGDAGGAGGGDGGGGDGFKMFESSILIGSDGECVLAPPRLLFTIKEETREDLDHEEKQQQQQQHKVKLEQVVLEVVSPSPQFLPKNNSRIDVCSSPSLSPSPSSLSSSIVRDSSSSLSSVASLHQQRRSSSCSSEADELVSAVATDEDYESANATPFVTPPSSPGFSTPSHSPPTSPLRQMQIALPCRQQQQQDRSSFRTCNNARYSSGSSRSNNESPPLSPLLVPMPVISSSNQPPPQQPQRQQPPPQQPQRQQPPPQQQQQQQCSVRMEELLSRNASSASTRRGK